MSDFLKKIKSVFVVDETDAQKAEVPVEKPVEKAQTSASEPAGTAEGNVNAQFYDLLFEALEKNNQEGFDYLEFRKALQTLASLPMDEQTRYHSAFAAAQAMGTSRQKLIDTAGIYLKTLQQEENKFQEALSKQRERQIGDKERHIEALEAGLKQKGEEIARLTREIQEGQAAVEKLKLEISDAVEKLDSKKNDFHATYSDLASRIEADVQKIGEYLK